MSRSGGLMTPEAQTGVTASVLIDCAEPERRKKLCTASGQGLNPSHIAVFSSAEANRYDIQTGDVVFTRVGETVNSRKRPSGLPYVMSSLCDFPVPYNIASHLHQEWINSQISIQGVATAACSQSTSGSVQTGSVDLGIRQSGKVTIRNTNEVESFSPGDVIGMRCPATDRDSMLGEKGVVNVIKLEPFKIISNGSIATLAMALGTNNAENTSPSKARIVAKQLVAQLVNAFKTKRAYFVDEDFDEDDFIDKLLDQKSFADLSDALSLFVSSSYASQKSCTLGTVTNYCMPGQDLNVILHMKQ